MHDSPSVMRSSIAQRSIPLRNGAQLPCPLELLFLFVILERSEESPYLLRGGTNSHQVTPKAGCPMHDSSTIMRGPIDRQVDPRLQPQAKAA